MRILQSGVGGQNEKLSEMWKFVKNNMIQEAEIQLIGEKNNLKFDTWIKILNDLNSNGVRNVTFLGPEPSLRSDFYNLLQHSIDIFDEVFVQTYGLHESSFSEYNFTAVFLFESFNPNEHNSLLESMGIKGFDIEKEIEFDDGSIQKRILGAYEWMMRKIARVQNKKIFRFKLYQNTDVMGAISLGWVNNGSVVFEPFYNYAGDIKENRIVPNKENLANVFRLCMEAKDRLGIEVSVDTSPFRLFDVKSAIKDVSHFENYRNASKEGISKIYVDYQGNVYPSEHIYYRFGNLLKQEYIKILNKSKEFINIVNNMSFGDRCRNCLGRDICGGQINHFYGENVRDYPGCPGPEIINWSDYLKIQLSKAYQKPIIIKT